MDGQVEVVTAQSWSLLATAYFQLEDYPNALDAQITAVDMAEVEGYTPKENWYVIMAACYEELKKQLVKKKLYTSN